MTTHFTAYEYHKLFAKVYYYRRLMKIGELSKKQQEKYEQYNELLETIKTLQPDLTKPKNEEEEENVDVEHIKMMMERNKERAKNRAKRIKEEKMKNKD